MEHRNDYYDFIIYVKTSEKKGIISRNIQEAAKRRILRMLDIIFLTEREYNEKHNIK